MNHRRFRIYIEETLEKKSKEEKINKKTILAEYY
jgi:hypothetical protein